MGYRNSSLIQRLINVEITIERNSPRLIRQPRHDDMLHPLTSRTEAPIFICRDAHSPACSLGPRTTCGNFEGRRGVPTPQCASASAAESFAKTPTPLHVSRVSPKTFIFRATVCHRKPFASAAATASHPTKAIVPKPKQLRGPNNCLIDAAQLSSSCVTCCCNGGSRPRRSLPRLPRFARSLHERSSPFSPSPVARSRPLRRESARGIRWWDAICFSYFKPTSGVFRSSTRLAATETKAAASIRVPEIVRRGKLENRIRDEATWWWRSPRCSPSFSLARACERIVLN